MDWQTTIIAGGLTLFVLLLAGWMNARRGIGRLSHLPWDYIMILSAILLIALMAHAAILWRDGYPF